MTIEQLLADAALLPVSDRLRIAEAIWDSLPEHAHPKPGPEIKAEFDRRVQRFRDNPESGLTLDELRKLLDADRAR